MTPEHLATARLLLEVASEVFEGEDFALKGGTAINFFLRDLPRLSVDLDLALTKFLVHLWTFWSSTHFHAKI